MTIKLCNTCGEKRIGLKCNNCGDMEININIPNHLVKKDLSVFLDRQNQILCKYENVEKLIPGTEDMTMRQFSLILDQYILQTAEELTETYTEIDIYRKDQSNEEELLFEIIDTTMYTGTIICLLDNAISNLNQTYKKLDYVYVMGIGSRNIDSLEKDINEITYSLIDIRRMNPERKWHKPYKEIKGFDVVERLMELRSRFYGLLAKEFLILVSYFDNYDIDKCIHNKQQFVIDLPVTTKRED